MSVEFQDFSTLARNALEKSARKFLEEAAVEIESEAKRSSPVDTGQLKGSWAHAQNTVALEAKIGSPLQNALWNEFGTGKFAVNGDGRKGGWRYQDDNDEWHFTRGKKPKRTLQKAFVAKRNAIINRAMQIFKEGMS